MGEENIFFSPYSISTALSMLYNGADGNTRREMAELLGYGCFPDILMNIHRG
jgi:serpin B